MSTLKEQQQQQDDGETTTTINDINNNLTGGCIVVVAKCPIPGKSKTRLDPLLGQGGSSELAKAMLSDVMLTLEHCPELNQVTKVLLYAPGDETGLSIMKDILNEIGIVEQEESTIIRTQEFKIEIGMEGSNNSETTEKVGGNNTATKSGGGGWRLLPMISPNLQSSDLGGILQHALDRVVDDMDAPWNNKKQEEPKLGSHGVVFLGMDAPEIPLSDIVKGLQLASSNKDGEHGLPASALLCPSDDGGYGMLCVPSTSVHKGIFQNVYWSHSLTAVSQLKALTDAMVPVVLGRLMHDIDEPEDVHKLRKRLSTSTTTTANKVVDDHESAVKKPQQQMGLEMYSSYNDESAGHAGMNDNNDTMTKVESKHEECKYTKLALEELGLLV